MPGLKRGAITGEVVRWEGASAPSLLPDRVPAQPFEPAAPDYLRDTHAKIYVGQSRH